MAKINLAIVHGIGINTQGYADPLISGVRRQFNQELRGILRASSDYSQELNFIPIAYPLKPLNKAYERVVLKDQQVCLGLFGIAHVKYWGGRSVHTIIARKLALDWLRFNQKLDKPELDRLYADYDKNVGLP